MANSVDLDEMAHYEPSHLDLHRLHMYLLWFAGLKELTIVLQKLFMDEPNAHLIT